MCKYDALWEHVQNRTESVVVLRFAEIETIAGLPIDHSFLIYKKELNEYGWKVAKISLNDQTVTFERLEASWQT